MVISSLNKRGVKQEIDTFFFAKMQKYCKKAGSKLYIKYTSLFGE